MQIFFFMSLHNNYAQISCPSQCHPKPGTTCPLFSPSTSSSESITLQSGLTAGEKQWVKLEARLAEDTVPQFLASDALRVIRYRKTY